MIKSPVSFAIVGFVGGGTSARWATGFVVGSCRRAPDRETASFGVVPLGFADGRRNRGSGRDDDDDDRGYRTTERQRRRLHDNDNDRERDVGTRRRD